MRIIPSFGRRKHPSEQLCRGSKERSSTRLGKSLWLSNISMKFQMISHQRFSKKAHTTPETKLCKKVPSSWRISMGCANKSLVWDAARCRACAPQLQRYVLLEIIKGQVKL